MYIILKLFIIILIYINIFILFALSLLLIKTVFNLLNFKIKKLINWVKYKTTYPILYQNCNYSTNSNHLKNTSSINSMNYLTNKITYTSNTSTYKNYYIPKRYIGSINELNFYIVLMEIAKELDLIVFSQVSLYSIIDTKKTLDKSTQTTYFNKISSKSIDFVLVNKKDCRIKLCIELDDSTHRKKNRIQRDEFINKLFKDLEIDLLRYPIYPVYYKETLKKRIIEHINEHYYFD